MRRFNIHYLTDLKAGRVHRFTRNESQDTNYYRALDYVRALYENVIPALSGDPKAKQEAKQVLFSTFTAAEGPFYHISIANCLEAAILMYFVDDAGVPCDDKVGSAKPEKSQNMTTRVSPENEL